MISIKSPREIDLMEKAGEMLVATGDMTENIQDQIDKIIVSVYGDETLIERMRNLLAHKHMERSTRV